MSSPMKKKKSSIKKSSFFKMSPAKKINSKMKNSPVKVTKTTNLDNIVDKSSPMKKKSVKKKSSSSKLSPAKKINSKMKNSPVKLMKTTKTTHLDNIIDKLAKSQQCAINAKKKKKCGSCVNCKMDNCGSCVNCKDMKCFGGEGKLKQACKIRKCIYLASAVGTSKQISTTSILASPTSSRSVMNPRNLAKNTIESRAPKPPPPPPEKTIRRNRILATSSSSLETDLPLKKKKVSFLSPVFSSTSVSP